jgi:hypothetical protein
MSSNNSLSRSYSSIDTLYNQDMVVSTSATSVKSSRPAVQQRLKSALIPQGSWLRKFTIRRNVEAAMYSDNFMAD